jgi:hypothetical protein
VCPAAAKAAAPAGVRPTRNSLFLISFTVPTIMALSLSACPASLLPTKQYKLKMRKLQGASLNPYFFARDGKKRRFKARTEKIE